MNKILVFLRYILFSITLGIHPFYVNITTTELLSVIFEELNKKSDISS